jgi:cytochrome b6-f complex iron-sulfur subunit
MIRPGEDFRQIETSIAIYRFLLQAYPASFRQEYGRLMVQLFRDDCRDALQINGAKGLVSLWLFTGIDLLRSSIKEHIRKTGRIPGRRFEMSESFAIRQVSVNRREFLNMAWMLSLGFLAVDLGAVTYLFTLPLLGEGEFGSKFILGRAGDVLPPPGGTPLNFPKGKFWLSRTHDNRLVAPYKVCPHLGCLYNWNEESNQFLCPCHYSQYKLDGTVMRGPAPRSTDRFVIRLLDESGAEVAATDDEGNPLLLPNEDLQVVVETGMLIAGKTKGIDYPVG